MKIGNKIFDLKNEVYIMGILNVTPDSFSDGGRWNEKDAALFRVEQMIKEGASIIDIGGESTRPGYTVISEDEEIDRVVPVIEAVKNRFDVSVSVDTYKSKVAEAACMSGADLVNDIWGLKGDKDMAKVIAKAGVPCCLMHNRNVEQYPYDSFIEDVLTDLKNSVSIALDAGIDTNKIILDPGVGFGKSYEQNLQIMNNCQLIRELGYPVLLGTSRKSMIGLTLDLPVEERLEGTIATTVMGVMKGCSIIRVHDVKENYRAVKMTMAILNKGEV